MLNKQHIKWFAAGTLMLWMLLTAIGSHAAGSQQLVAEIERLAAHQKVEAGVTVIHIQSGESGGVYIFYTRTNPTQLTR